MRPLEFFGVEMAGRLTSEDRLLMTALTLYERSLCPDCATPTRISCDPNMDGWYEIDDSCVCHACAARERYQKQRQNQDFEPGLKLRTVDTKHEGG